MWDAIISISALFESPELCPDLVFLRQEDSRTLNQNHRDALGWYSRSVSTVRQQIERGHVDIFVGLISCILFICIEVLQGGVEEALQLYGQGVHLILALRAQIACRVVPATKASLLEDTIAPIFVRLGAIALTISGVPVADLLRDTEHALTQEFVSLKSAREAIVLLAAEAQLFQHTCEEHLLKSHASHVPQELTNQQITLSARLRSWHTAFINLMEFLRTKDILSPQQIGTEALLFTYHETLFVIVAICVSPLQIITDAYIPNFQNIVEQSSIALDASARSDGTQPPFTFEISVGFPLWFTCLRCREPRIRRTALALIRRALQVQGFYKCTTGATLGERIMLLEETYGMAMNAAQGRTNFATPESKIAPSEYQPHSRGNSSDVSRFDFSSLCTFLDSDICRKPISCAYGHGNQNTNSSAHPRRGTHWTPFGIFRPRDGFPPGTTEEDIVKWNRSRDQTYLRFSRNEHDLASDTWQMVYECIPITVNPGDNESN